MTDTTVTHTYPDGSARVGCPPFPKLSPLQQAQGMEEPAKPETVEVPVPATAAKKTAAKKDKDA